MVDPLAETQTRVKEEEWEGKNIRFNPNEPFYKYRLHI